MLRYLSRIFVVLLVGHMLLIQCVACIPSSPQSHTCCQKRSAPATNNHCGKPLPATTSCNGQDQATALDRSDSAHRGLAPVAAVAIQVQSFTAVPTTHESGVKDKDETYSSPPLFVLHATYLI
jgi:hypothetical protein